MLAPRHSRLRVAVGRTLTAALLAPPIRTALDSIIRIALIRRTLNVVYDRWGARGIGLLFRKMYPAERPPGEFVWRHTARAGTLLFPVSPSLSQSWLYAQLWSGPNYVPPKGLYAWYLAQRPAGVFFDLGANRGMMSYPLARAGPDLLIEIGVLARNRGETWALLEEFGYRVYAVPVYGDRPLLRVASFDALASTPTIDFFCARDETLVVGGGRETLA